MAVGDVIAGNALTVGLLGFGTTAALNPRAVLELKSTTGALLVPRMTTTQRDAFGANVANGMIIYNTTTTTIQGYQGAGWTNL